MIIVYIKGKRKKEYKNLFLKNSADQTIVCKELHFSGYVWLAELEDNEIILKGY